MVGIDGWEMSTGVAVNRLEDVSELLGCELMAERDTNSCDQFVVISIEFENWFAKESKLV